ncbi:PREDICTED: probably inactive leucine-rich repeat receptor-like protein kinase At5g48380 [Ipomoea nil]|uniref:probably inactive leucine-rich repeat receptor-like protein kinase At5g48380 n=1 Tax=Ipomoea nil TaxID=35883 RepID=UPI000900DCEE|nr:PREDICTED: probably inactive leucine-rich repeat receptor-like protein kinase At5g48380 [Ipomoea nil]XP_019166705.1 PREDICTED: probably inactive leucine-rich repeat receptor-like protein kinase At5g48380 [Ipomoea nil]XP_019166712.1 PREDICTED: probably inactive leucine-rich repeat receptor-like protein kinase At5g48380 [Ipomoea nil]
MALNYRPVIASIFGCFLLSSSLCYCLQSDIDCLKSVKKSLEDPLGYLDSWNFNNNTEGFICRFIGVDCWHPDENKVLNIRLSNMELGGRFPLGLRMCEAMTGLDLSSNKINGSIPANISKIVGFLTTLDLSSNRFSGEIPLELANCTYLNVLKLDNNQLTGQIPLQIGQLGRMKDFSVANNRLSGPVPHFTGNYSAPADNYANNLGLCGAPLADCKAPPKKTNSGAIAGAAVGGVSVGIIGLAIVMYFIFRRASRKRKDDDPDGNKWAKSIKGAKAIKLSMFEQSVSKMRLSDLMQATDNFHKCNIIGSGRTGTFYKAVLADGTSLMVKRLQNTQHSEKEFESEMATLGAVKHRNMVPLLGYCMAKQERLLVYKYMSNGTLNNKLHFLNEGEEPLDWTLRLKIGIGAAKGFAWLHHNCNPRILHRNISSKCILLDADFEPKISDFGLARLMNPVDTHLSTFVNGEFGDLGYVAPEYARTLVATPKGDVYSFGVVLLELVTGERPTYVSKAPETFKGSLVEWITILSGESKLKDSIDTSLVGKGYDAEVLQVLKVACRCVLPAVPKERPSMFEVYQLLRAIGEHYHFTTDDEILLPTETEDGFQLEELIVARET